jgi:hypothetical protein
VIRTKPHLTVLLALAMYLTGCADPVVIDTSAVLTHGNCKQLQAGLHIVTLADVAQIRGTQLISSSGVGLNDGMAHSSDPQAVAELPLFVAISRGVQASRGFGLHLADQTIVRRDNALEIQVYWDEPDLTKAQPLINTHPCLVVSLAPGPWQSITAIDQHGDSLGVLDL